MVLSINKNKVFRERKTMLARQSLGNVEKYLPVV